jgi:ABC-type transporter Mla MlaB component
MIHIEETVLDHNTITIKLEGVLDHSALPVIQSVCERYLKSHRAIHLDLEGLIHITREGRNFLNEIKQNVSLTHLPEFMQLENSPEGTN